MKRILMGTHPRQFADGNYQSVMISVTEDCNLRCKYCYMTGKNDSKRMSFETAKKIVDFVLTQEPRFSAVAWEFIGGEPTLEMALIDQIADYAKRRMYELNHIWFNNYIFNIGTNGILYDSTQVQHFIKKNAMHVTAGITIDGNEQKHDLQRITKEGTGSYKQVVRNIPLWLKQMPGSTTKVTFASEDLRYLKDSIIHLWNLGIKNIPANVVFEDVWRDGDDILFEEQLRDLADYVIDNNYCENYSVRFYDRTIGFPLGKTRKAHNFCGSGKMIAFDCEGRIYPCVRFYEICQDGNTICVGDVDHGIDNEKQALLNKTCIGMVNDNECSECSVASGCFACAGNNYRYTHPHTVYKRTKFNCKMHKANVRANEYFWDKWILQNDLPSPHELERIRHYQSENWKLDGAKYLYFVLSTPPIQYCSYIAPANQAQMTKASFDRGVHFAYDNYMIPIYLGDPSRFLDRYSRNKLHVRIDRYSDKLTPINEVEVIIPIFDSTNYKGVNKFYDTSIVIIDKGSIQELERIHMHLFHHCKNIRIIPQNYWNWSDAEIEEYKKQLHYIGTDNLIDENGSARNDCRAGISEFALCPDERIYPCPGFYYYGHEAIGDVKTGISKDFSELVMLNKSIDCLNCPDHQCPRCSLINTLRHGMPNVPASIQCQMSIRRLTNNTDIIKESGKSWEEI